MYKKIFGMAAVALLSVTLVACTDEKETETPVAETPVTETEKAPAKVEANGNVVAVDLSATNFQFDQTEVKVKVGDTIKFTLANESGLHGVALDEFGMELKAGETFEYVVTEAGEFEFYCNIPCGTGHDNMMGKIIVS